MGPSYAILCFALSGLCAYVLGDPQRSPPPSPSTTLPITAATTTTRPNVPSTTTLTTRSRTDQPQIVNLAPAIAGVATSVVNLLRPVTGTPVAAFSCRGRVPGYYADVNSGCRNYFTCSPGGRRDYYSCGERTIFNQWLLICDHWRNYDCRLAPYHYDVNERRRPFENRPTRRPKQLRTTTPSI